jgi:UDP-N-acetylmuramate: L-alanyl-gamma-D-glutamyl-meso-diaminopimelate ligase
MALLIGIKKDKIVKAVKSFLGVKRRQELIFNHDKIKIYEDFAHHPTAIKGMIDELKKIYPDSVIWAVYEPRSATSRRNVLQNELADAFDNADKIIIKKPYRLESIPASERIDIDRVVKIITGKGIDITTAGTADEIVEGVFNTIDSSNRNIILLMSNGGFDGIYKKIINKLTIFIKN